MYANHHTEREHWLMKWCLVNDQTRDSNMIYIIHKNTTQILMQNALSFEKKVDLRRLINTTLSKSTGQNHRNMVINVTYKHILKVPSHNY